MMNIAERLTCTKPLLGAVLTKLTENHLQVELRAGVKDCVNGYGWHTLYFVKVIKTIEYCSKCRRKLGKDYSDDAHPFSNHRHDHERKVIYTGEFMSEENLCNELLLNCT